MPTGPEHFKDAELMLKEAEQFTANEDGTCPDAERFLRYAQVHATLALAAATALNVAAVIKGPEDADVRRDVSVWSEVAGVPPRGPEEETP